MNKILYFILAAVLLTGCQKDSSDDGTDTEAFRHTVFVYMSAENNLSGYVQGDINEMISGRKKVGDDCDLLIYVDRASMREKPFIARIHNRNEHPVDTLYQYPADFYSSDPALFHEVLQRMVSFSPYAEDYGIVFWGHANGWIFENDGTNVIRRAYGGDNGNNAGSETPVEPTRWINMPDMAKALQQTGIHWRFLFFDCCDMQNAEVAYELRNVTEYIIASPAEIPGAGAPYDKIVKDFFIADDKGMYSGICHDYYEQKTDDQGYVSPSGTLQMPISVIKTSQMEALADATRQIMPDIEKWLKTSNPTQGIIYYYTYNRDKGDVEKIMYDMKHMIRAALASQPEKYDAWESVFRQAVCYAEYSLKWYSYSIISRDFAGATVNDQGCVSMFFPLAKYDHATHSYNEDIKKTQWYQAISR